jgi:hypothetical protein
MTTVAGLSVSRLLIMISGFVIWSVCFIVLYGVLSIGCRLGWQEPRLVWELGPLNALLAGLWVLHLIPIGWLIRREWRLWQASAEAQAQAPTFLAAVSAMLQIAAFVSTIAIGFVVLTMPPCV